MHFLTPFSIALVATLFQSAHAHPGGCRPHHRDTACGSAKFPPVPIVNPPTPAVPAGNVTVPKTALNYLGLGIGTQNYTCTNGSFVNTGAVATLHDVSHAEVAPSTLAKQAFKDPSGVSSQYRVLGHHYFTQSTFSPSALPKFNFVDTLDSSDAFVLTKKVASVPSPLGATTAVAWLQLSVAEGKLGSTVLRTDTQAGVLTGSCSVGQTSTAKYTALYWFYA